jgi:hypothetical protein
VNRHDPEANQRPSLKRANSGAVNSPSIGHGPDLLAFPVFMCLSQTHPGPTDVFVDELDTRGLQRAATSLIVIVSCCHGGVPFGELSTANRAQAYRRWARKVPCSPSDECSGSPDLRAN